jgi:hypothetical protein
MLPSKFYSRNQNLAISFFISYFFKLAAPPNNLESENHLMLQCKYYRLRLKHGMQQKMLLFILLFIMLL